MTAFALAPSPAQVRVRGWAEFSPCGKYRYLLGREWDPGLPRVLVVGLNPSKAGADIPDMTVTKLVGFGERWGAGSFEVVNPFAYIATDPRYLHVNGIAGLDIVGPDNDHFIDEAISRASKCVIAWGGDAGHKFLKPRVVDVLAKLKSLPLFCLDPTKDGFPRHPSRAPYSTPLVPFGGAR